MAKFMGVSHWYGGRQILSETCACGLGGQDTYRVIFNSLVHNLLIKMFTCFVAKKGPKGSDLKPVEVYLSL